MRRCNYCGQTFPRTADYFPRDKNRKGGVKSICRECNRAMHRKGGKYYNAANGGAKYSFERDAGVHYKTVLPEEKWTMMQFFLGSLQYFASQAEAAGVRPNVADFMAEWGGHTRGREVSR